MAETVLYSFRRCPYAMRARMALSISGTDYEHREVVLRDKPPQMLEASAKGTVPVLVLADGRVIDESLDVMRWALEQPLALVSVATDRRADALLRQRLRTMAAQDPATS